MSRGLGVRELVGGWVGVLDATNESREAEVNNRTGNKRSFVLRTNRTSYLLVLLIHTASNISAKPFRDPSSADLIHLYPVVAGQGGVGGTEEEADGGKALG